MSLTLTFDGRTIELKPDDEGRYNLNALHKAAGNAAKHQPNRWLRSAQAIDLIEKFLTTQKRVIKSVSGRYGGTFAIREIVFAYAEWISADFHKAVIDTFSAAVDGDGEKAVKSAESVVRTKSRKVRKDAMSEVCAATGGHDAAYSVVTNAVYLQLFGGNAAALKEGLNTKKIRDKLSDSQLHGLMAAESLLAATCSLAERRDLSLKAAEIAAGAAGAIVSKATDGRLAIFRNGTLVQ